MGYNKDYNVLIYAFIFIGAIILFQTNITALTSDLFNTSTQKVPEYITTPAQIPNPVSLPYTVKSISPNIKVEQNRTNRIVTLDFVAGAGSPSSAGQGIMTESDPIALALISLLQLVDLTQNASIAQLQENSTLDLVATYPLNISGGLTKTLTIDPSFNDLDVKTITRNTTGDVGVNNIVSIIELGLNHFRFGLDSLVGGPSTNITITDGVINISSANINLIGSVDVNGKDLEAELVKTSVKSFQADYLNTSQLYTDIIIIPQDVRLTNITSLVEKSTNATNFTLNFSIEKYSTYPTSKTTILAYSMSSEVNTFNSINYDFNDRDIILLNYTTYTNVSKSSSLFKFMVR